MSFPLLSFLGHLSQISMELRCVQSIIYNFEEERWTSTQQFIWHSLGCQSRFFAAERNLQVSAVSPDPPKKNHSLIKKAKKDSNHSRSFPFFGNFAFKSNNISHNVCHSDAFSGPAHFLHFLTMHKGTDLCVVSSFLNLSINMVFCVAQSSWAIVHRAEMTQSFCLNCGEKEGEILPAKFSSHVVSCPGRLSLDWPDLLHYIPPSFLFFKNERWGIIKTSGILPLTIWTGQQILYCFSKLVRVRMGHNKLILETNDNIKKLA